jgi:hypothetical protein
LSGFGGEHVVSGNKVGLLVTVLQGGELGGLDSAVNDVVINIGARRDRGGVVLLSIGNIDFSDLKTAL